MTSIAMYNPASTFHTINRNILPVREPLITAVHLLSFSFNFYDHEFAADHFRRNAPYPFISQHSGYGTNRGVSTLKQLRIPNGSEEGNEQGEKGKCEKRNGQL